jgi:hypothetical protein
MPKLQILVVNEPRDVPTKAGGTFQVQDAETVILGDDGNPVVVGPLGIPRDLVGKVLPGLYDATFKWERDYKTGRLVNSLVSLAGVVSTRPVARPSASAAA